MELASASGTKVCLTQSPVAIARPSECMAPGLGPWYSDLLQLALVFPLALSLPAWEPGLASSFQKHFTPPSTATQTWHFCLCF